MSQLPATSNFRKAMYEVMEGGRGVIFRGDKYAVLRRDMDDKIKKWKGLGVSAARPSHGWIRAVRESLGMSAHQLARRLATCPSNITRLERSEDAGTINLANLQRAAKALDCKVVYALVPEAGSLHETLLRRRTDLAKKIYHRQHGYRNFTVAETIGLSSLCGDYVHASKVWNEDEAKN